MIYERIKTINLKQGSRLFVVGDIHGFFDELIAQLKLLGFDFQKDILIILGDFIDRGPQSEQCSSLPDYSWAEPLRGNHEDSCIKGYTDYGVEIYHKQSENGGAWFYQLPLESQNKIVDSFTQLPILIEVIRSNKVIGFVHGDVPVEDWELLKEYIANDDVAPDEESYAHKCMWRNSVYRKTNPIIAFVDEVYLGHTLVKTPEKKGNCNFIETGISNPNFGKLTVMEVSL